MIDKRTRGEAAAAAEINPETINRLIIGIVRGKSVEALRDDLARAGATEAVAEAHIEDAQAQIALAAQFDRVHQIGLAIKRLNRIFESAIDDDPKTALATQKEISKMMDLYKAAEKLETERAGPSDQADAYAKQLATIRDHIAPLKLAGEDYPITEHVRIAAGLIRDMSEGK